MIHPHSRTSQGLCDGPVALCGWRCPGCRSATALGGVKASSQSHLSPSSNAKVAITAAPSANDSARLALVAECALSLCKLSRHPDGCRCSLVASSRTWRKRGLSRSRRRSRRSNSRNATAADMHITTSSVPKPSHPDSGPSGLLGLNSSATAPTRPANSAMTASSVTSRPCCRRFVSISTLSRSRRRPWLDSASRGVSSTRRKFK